MLIAGQRVPRMRGFTIIELMITIAILGILLAIGLPSMGKMLQNGQIRTAAESAAAGLQFARNEAIRRNAPVRFQLTSDLTAACTQSSTGTSWVVSLATPAGACNTAPVDPSALTPASPAILQKRSGTEGTPRATLAGTSGGAAATTITFNGVGRLAGTGNIDTLNFAHVSETCEHASGTMRCLRLIVSTGGTIKMCDPKVTDTTDPRYCAL